MLSEKLVFAIAAYLRKRPFEEVAEFLYAMEAERVAAQKAEVKPETPITETPA